MRPLVVVRRATGFDPAFVDRDPLLRSVEPAYRRLGPCEDFPPAEILDRVFAGEAPVRFVRAGAGRRRGEAVDLDALYDARIVVDGEVPTRPRCWHDLMNALAWGTFPTAKRALHARQHRVIRARVVPGARSLPPRSRELDALALLDEGGVVVLARDPAGASRSLASREPGTLRRLLGRNEVAVVVFGHAIYESLALGARPAVVAALVASLDGHEADPVRAADGALAQVLHDTGRLLDPRELVRVDLGEARLVAARAG